MASSLHSLLLLSFIFFFISPSETETPPDPKTLVLPVSKDKCTSQYIIQINSRTPSVPVKLAIDLGQEYMWINCEEDYVSSSYRHAGCNSNLCSIAGSIECNTDSGKPICSKMVVNRVVEFATYGDLGQDTVSVQSLSQKNPVSLPNFPFLCGISYLIESLADGASGIAGLGRNTNLSLPVLFSKAFGFPKKFAICLSSSTIENGLIFFGEVPSSVTPKEPLTYTPLTITGQDYSIGVKSIKVGGKEITVDKNLLSGGAIISTVKPYAVLHTSIYKAILKNLTEEYNLNVYRAVPAVPVPFEACYSAAILSSEDFLSLVPQIDIELESGKGKKVYWRISGANSILKVADGSKCLAFIDGGTILSAPIIIGGRQLEDIFLQFDLPNSRLGFSSNLLSKNRSCSSLVKSV